MNRSGEVVLHRSMDRPDPSPDHGPAPDPAAPAPDRDDALAAAFRASFDEEIRAVRRREEAGLDADRVAALDRAVLDPNALDRAVAATDPPRGRLRFRLAAAGSVAAAVLLVCSAALILRGVQDGVQDGAPGRLDRPAPDALANAAPTDAAALPPASSPPATDAATADERADWNRDGAVNVVDAYLAARALDAARRAGDADALARGPILERTIERILEESVRVDAALAERGGGAS